MATLWQRYVIGGGTHSSRRWVPLTLRWNREEDAAPVFSRGRPWTHNTTLEHAHLGRKGGLAIGEKATVAPPRGTYKLMICWVDGLRSRTTITLRLKWANYGSAEGIFSSPLPPPYSAVP